MQAVADSNLVKMATLWGTASGPASKTNQPPDWQRRIAIMQAYLRNDSFRITSDEPETDVNRRGLLVERRNGKHWKLVRWTRDQAQQLHLDGAIHRSQDRQRFLDRHPDGSGCGREPGASLSGWGPERQRSSGLAREPCPPGAVIF